MADELSPEQRQRLHDIEEVIVTGARIDSQFSTRSRTMASVETAATARTEADATSCDTYVTLDTDVTYEMCTTGEALVFHQAGCAEPLTLPLRGEVLAAEAALLLTRRGTLAFIRCERGEWTTERLDGTPVDLEQ